MNEDAVPTFIQITPGMTDLGAELLSWDIMDWVTDLRGGDAEDKAYIAEQKAALKARSPNSAVELSYPHGIVHG